MSNRTVRPESVVASKLFLLDLKGIKSAAWNPPNRVEERRIRMLQESIEDIGLLYPILVDESRNLVDGHRRVAVAKRLGWKHIQAIQVNGEFEHTYGSIQANQMKLSGNDLLCVFLSNPHALLSKQRRQFERIDELCGYDALKLLYKSGATASAFSLAERVYRYVEGKVDLMPILRWMLKHTYTRRVRAFMDAGVSANVMRRAIENDAPMKVKLQADE